MFKYDCDYGCIYFSNYSEFIYRLLLARFTKFSKIMREKKAVGLNKPRVGLIFVLIVVWSFYCRYAVYYYKSFYIKYTINHTEKLDKYQNDKKDKNMYLQI